MNEKFYILPEEKQLAIINAAYKVFATNQYKKAPTSEIAAEAQISKSLLFHYFHNKLELYIFLWNYAKDMTTDFLIIYQVYETDDFFEMMRRGLKAKCMLLQKYTFLSLFSINAFFETDPDIQEVIQQSVQDATDIAFGMISSKINFSQIRDDIDFECIYKEILYASDGMLNHWYQTGNFDVDSFEQEYLDMITHWEIIYRKGEQQ